MPVINPFKAIDEDYQFVDTDFEPDSLSSSITDGSGTYVFHTQQIAKGQVNPTILAQYVAFLDNVPSGGGGGGGDGDYATTG